ncbi:hypothetical protein [Flavobacterium ovatum]|uniref:hypothetical protein n=1 Tax=Flavobacterium ovatum TaxID=1928857 RepID=UPI00344EA061
MRIFRIVIMVLAILVILVEYYSTEKMIYLRVGAIVVFMYGMMQLSAKTPSKNQNKEEDDIK